MNNLIKKLVENPDDIKTLSAIRQLEPGSWIFELRNREILQRLELREEDIYSKTSPYMSNQVDNKEINFKYSFPCDDVNLSKFLINSIPKKDILKPYGDNNKRSQAKQELYLLKNARIICTNLSIGIFTNEGKLVKELSHNACESLYLFNKYRNDFPVQRIKNAMFASVQQRFNLGHWYIDTIPKIYSGLQFLESYGKKISNLLVDCADHQLIKESLMYLTKEINVIPTLPFIAIDVEELYVPMISDFSHRVTLGQLIINKIYTEEVPVELVDGSETNLNIYLSRQNMDRRKIINHEEVSNVLRERNYIEIFPEKLGMKKVKWLISRAKNIIGINGAAMCNSLFINMKRQTNLRILYTDKHYDDYYFRVAESLGLNFFGATIDKGINRDEENMQTIISKYYYPDIAENISVDIDRLNSIVICDKR